MNAVPSRTRALRWGVALAAVAIFGAVGFLSTRGGTTGTPQGVTGAQEWDLPRLDGKGRVGLADFRGRPVVANFFASWCTSCRFELPGFAKVSRELEGQVQFVGVNSQETGDGMAMARQYGIDWWPLARDVGGKQASGLHEALGGRGMPITAFYSADGRLVDFVGGAISEKALRERLRELYGVNV